MSKTKPADTAVTNNGIEVTLAGSSTECSWNTYVDQSAQGTVFQRQEFLDVVADQVNADLHQLVGFKGQEPVGVFPVFELTRGLTTTVFSPPPNQGLSQMGMAMLSRHTLKQRKEEKRTRRFLQACFDWIDEALDPSYVHLRTHHRHDDHRPFVWNGFELTPRYTYVLDLTGGPDRLLDEFSSDARRNIRNTDGDAYEISERGIDGIQRIVGHLASRHDEQGLNFPVTSEFVEALARSLPDGTLRSYVITVDGEYASGMITVEDVDTIYRWQGGARPRRDISVPVNDVLDWHIMTEAMDRGLSTYDLIGANTQHVSEYKSKFGPELVTYYTAERGTRAMQMVSRLYQHLR